MHSHIRLYGIGIGKRNGSEIQAEENKRCSRYRKDRGPEGPAAIPKGSGVQE